jgi:hypothetical protein
MRGIDCTNRALPSLGPLAASFRRRKMLGERHRCRIRGMHITGILLTRLIVRTITAAPIVADLPIIQRRLSRHRSGWRPRGFNSGADAKSCCVQVSPPERWRLPFPLRGIPARWSGLRTRSELPIVPWEPRSILNSSSGCVCRPGSPIASIAKRPMAGSQ